MLGKLECLPWKTDAFTYCILATTNTLFTSQPFLESYLQPQPSVQYANFSDQTQFWVHKFEKAVDLQSVK